MHLKAFSSLLTASQLIHSAWSYGTIVEVYPSTCPAIPTGPAMPATQYLLTVNPGPVNISPRAVAPTYISANGSTTTDCSAAAPFALTSGQLSSNGQFVSTTGLVPYSPLVVSSYLAAISTTFSTMTVMNGSSLAWNNTAFTGGHALFCVMGNTVEAVYNGQLPAGCAQIYIGYVFVTACPTFKPSNSVTQLAGGATGTGTSSPSPTASLSGSVKGKNVTANPLGCLSSSGNSPAVSGGLIPKTVTTLEDCADFCSSYAYFGVQSGFCVCGNTLASSATPAAYGSCNVLCPGNNAETCGGASAMAVYIISGRSGSSSSMSGSSMTTGTGSAGQVNASTTATTSSMTTYVTSTGAPNCYDRSPFDHTVNGGYLILCNTALPGYDLMRANGTNLAECIAACNAHSSGPASSVCVAVTFDITASSNQCTLKTNIGPVNSGAEDLSEAAINVTGNYAPQIVFATATSTMSSTAASTGSTSTTSTVSGSMANTAAGNSSSTTGTVSGSMANTAAGNSSSASTPGTSASQGPLPTATNPSGPLCPSYNGQVVKIGGSFYQVECSTDTVGDTLVGNTTTAASLAECGGYCNLYNLAIPYGCVGVTMVLTSSSSNCYLKSRIIGTQFRAQDDSLRLIYPGYPTPVDPILTATSSSGAASSSMGVTASTETTTQSSSSTGPTATGALCPAYDGRTLYFPSYGGSNYEVECSTSFVDTGLSPVIATGLPDCINQCSFLNLNTETPQCVGVTFLNTAQTSPPTNNCYPKGSITDIVRGVPQDDSARLIFQGYPSATDIGTTSMSSTLIRTLSSTSTSTSSTQSTGSTQLIASTQSTSTSSTVTASSITTSSRTSTGTSTKTSTSISTGSSSSSTSTSVATSNDPSSTSTSTTRTSTGTSVPSPTDSLCPTYNFQIVQAGNYQYEVECGYEFIGHDIGLPYTPYPNIQSFQQCLAACNYWNDNTATTCVAADFRASINACYLKDSITSRISSLTINGARLIYSGYPSITDAVSTSVSTTTASTLTSSMSTSTATGLLSSTSISTSTSTSSTLTSSTSTTSGSSPTQATATATASVYPADPVCPGNNGGQLTSSDSNLYDIECNVDLRFAASDLPSSGILRAAAYSACALFCDQYNLNAGAQICQGFTWDSTSTSATTTNCVLKSALIQTSTTNTANTNGVHSGRLLGPWPATNQVILSKPIPLVTNTLYNGYSVSYDFAALTAPGGLTWQITEFNSSALYVGAMGFVALMQTDQNNQLGLTSLSGSNNNNSQPYTLPSAALPTYAVAPYWTRGYASLDSQQGIYYQIDTVSTGRYFISIEFYYARYTTNNDVFHWITTYDTGNPGVWISWYFSGGTADDRGLYETVGHQGTKTINGVTGSTIAAMYEHGTSGTVLAGDKILSNTNPGTNTVVHTSNAFDAVAYGAPGTWSFTNSPT